MKENKMSIFKTRTNLDIVNPTLAFLSEVGTDINEAEQKIVNSFSSKKEVIGNKEVKYGLRSFYYINSEENKLFTAIQQLVETSKIQNQINQIEVVEKKVKIEDGKSNILEELPQNAYKVDFNINDLCNVLNISKKTERQSVIRRIDNLIKKLNYLFVELEITNLETGNKLIPAPMPIYKINTMKYKNQATEYEVLTSPLDFFNIKNRNEDLIIEHFKEHSDLKQYTKKDFNPFENLKGIEINIFQILTYKINTFNIKKEIEYSLEDLVFELYKHEELEKNYLQYKDLIKEGMTAKEKELVFKYNEELRKVGSIMKERKKYVRTKIKSLSTKKGAKFSIYEKNNKVFVKKL